MIKQIIDDTRNIKRITFPDYNQEGSFYEVGMNLAGKKISKILPYEENGDMAIITYFAIYFDDNEVIGEKIAYRINGRFVDTIQYE